MIDLRSAPAEIAMLTAIMHPVSETDHSFIIRVPPPPQTLTSAAIKANVFMPPKKPT